MAFFLVMNFLPMRSMPAGKLAVEIHSSTTLWYWTLGLDGKRGHMAIFLLPSKYMHLIFFLEYFNIYFSLRFSEKYRREIEHYTSLHDSITDFETNYPGLATSSRAVNKLAKVVSISNFI